jgi:predicted DNA-binding WGR domain protein
MRIEFRSDTRGYILALERDLFGAFVLVRRWYGLGNRRGGVKREVFLQEDTALRELKRIERLRVRHGYRRLDE